MRLDHPARAREVAFGDRVDVVLGDLVRRHDGRLAARGHAGGDSQRDDQAPHSPASGWAANVAAATARASASAFEPRAARPVTVTVTYAPPPPSIASVATSSFWAGIQTATTAPRTVSPTGIWPGSWTPGPNTWLWWLSSVSHSV